MRPGAVWWRVAGSWSKCHDVGHFGIRGDLIPDQPEVGVDVGASPSGTGGDEFGGDQPGAPGQTRRRGLRAEIRGFSARKKKSTKYLPSGFACDRFATYTKTSLTAWHVAPLKNDARLEDLDDATCAAADKFPMVGDLDAKSASDSLLMASTNGRREVLE